MVMLQSGSFCAGVVRDTNIPRPELIFLKKSLPFILWAVFQKHTIYNGISMIYSVLFLKKQISFYGWRHRYKPFHLSPSTPVMQKVSRQTWNSLRLSMIFATKDSFSQILENKPPFLKFWKKKLPLSALPYPSPLQRYRQRMSDASYGWSKIFSRP